MSTSESHSTLEGARFPWAVLGCLLLVQCSGKPPGDDDYRAEYCEEAGYPPPSSVDLADWTGEPTYFFNPDFNWSGQTHPIESRFKLNPGLFAGEACLGTVPSEDEVLQSFMHATGAWSGESLSVAFHPDFDSTDATPASVDGDYDYNYAWCSAVAHPDSTVVDGEKQPTLGTFWCDFKGVLNEAATDFEYYCGPRRCDVTVDALGPGGEALKYQATDWELSPGEWSLTSVFKHELGHVIGIFHNDFGFDVSIMSECLPPPADEPDKETCDEWDGSPNFIRAIDYQARNFLYTD